MCAIGWFLAFGNSPAPARRFVARELLAVLTLTLAVGAIGVATAGCSPGANGCGGAGNDGGSSLAGGGGGSVSVGASNPLRRGQQVLFIGGLMSGLYEAFSINLEREMNESLRETARSLNLHLDLPLDRSIDIAMGDAIADALPWFTLPLHPGGFISFHTQEAHFTALGIPFQNLSDASYAFDSSETIAHNAAAIRVFLRRRAADQFVIVTHSKGGLDTLHALLDAEDLWGSTVVGWVALQAPFYGSPIADSPPSALSGPLVDALGGKSATLDDLKTSTRSEYMKAHEARIRLLTSKIPVITAYSTYEAGNGVTTFAGTFANSILDADLVSDITQIVRDNYAGTPRDVPRVVAKSTRAAVELIRVRVITALSEGVASLGLMDLTNIYMNGVLDQPNDGLVPAQSTVIPGAAHRRLPLGDHASPVMDVDPLKNFWTADLRNAVTMSLIDEVVTKAGARKGGVR